MTCDRVQIISNGRLVFSDHIANLNQQMDSTCFCLGLKQPPPTNQLLSIEGVVEVEELDDGRLRIHHSRDNSPASRIAAQAASENWGLYELSPEYKTLEHIFVEITSSEEPGQMEGVN